jgi:hypothetical protein
MPQSSSAHNPVEGVPRSVPKTYCQIEEEPNREDLNV